MYRYFVGRNVAGKSDDRCGGFEAECATKDVETHLFGEGAAVPTVIINVTLKIPKVSL